MSEMSYVDEAFSAVLADEATCRTLVKELQKRGVTFSVDPTTLKHEDLIEAVLAIYSELGRIELSKQREG